ncbi:MAG TPA: NAD-dependent epimerase/dehydratase family protein [Thermoanaerobaculia bacterium]|nr:NAD-dependent epimerase/dehydratase family protein [Thermoanaerobaculia bacterium]
MTVLVTGASGFLGRPLVRALLDAGRHVVALSRNPAALADLRHPALRITPGDFRDPASYSPGLAPGISVFHLAAARNHPHVRAREMEEVNVRATAELARRSLEAGVGRFVHVSTALIHGPADGGGVPFGAYAESKARAVQEIRRLADEGLQAVIVSPAIVYGPDHPSHPNRVTSEIRRLLRQRIVRVVGGGRQARNLVHVDDVVHGLLAAEQRGTVGEEYLLGGEEIAPRDFGRLVLSLAGLRPVATLSLPAGPALAAARIADRLRKSDQGTGYTVAVQVLLREWRFSSDKARRDLEYCPLSLAEGLAHTIDWLREADHGCVEMG